MTRLGTNLKEVFNSRLQAIREDNKPKIQYYDIKYKELQKLVDSVQLNFDRDEMQFIRKLKRDQENKALMKEKIEHEYNSPKKLKKNKDIDPNLKNGLENMQYIEWDEDMKFDDAKIEYGTNHYVKDGDGYVIKGKLVDAFGKIPGRAPDGLNDVFGGSPPKQFIVDPRNNDERPIPSLANGIVDPRQFAENLERGVGGISLGNNEASA